MASASGRCPSHGWDKEWCGTSERNLRPVRHGHRRSDHSGGLQTDWAGTLRKDSGTCVGSHGDIDVATSRLRTCSLRDHGRYNILQKPRLDGYMYTRTPYIR